METKTLQDTRATFAAEAEQCNKLIEQLQANLAKERIRQEQLRGALFAIDHVMKQLAEQPMVKSEEPAGEALPPEASPTA